MTDQVSQPSEKSQRKKRLWNLLIILVLAVAFVLLGFRLFKKDATRVEIGESPQNFTLMTFDGDQIDLSDLKGKVVLINFWASWCVPCEDEAALLQEAWLKLQEEAPGEVAFLGVAYMDTEPAAQAFLEGYEVTYPNGQDLRGEISDLFQVTGVPETYFLDKEGRLQTIKFGPFVSLEEIIGFIDLLHTPDGGE